MIQQGEGGDKKIVKVRTEKNGPNTVLLLDNTWLLNDTFRWKLLGNSYMEQPVKLTVKSCQCISLAWKLDF